MSQFDNLFTNKLFYGTKDSNFNNVLDMSKNLNKMLWLQMNIPDSRQSELGNITKTSSFFIVKKFSSNDSKLIKNAIDLKYNVYFDDNGNLKIVQNENVILNFQNPLHAIKFDSTNPGNIFTSKSGTNDKPIYRKDLILNSNGKWILYTLNDICYILYNPLHRTSFKNYYLQNLKNDNTNIISSVSNLFTKYCETLSSTIDENVPRTYADNSCNCIRIEDCIDNAVGSKISDPKFRNSVGNNCLCIAPNCDTNLYVSSDSFMNPTDGYKQIMKEKKLGGNCPDQKIILCSTKIEAGGNVNLVGSKLSQTCGENAPSAPTTATRAPLTSTDSDDSLPITNANFQDVYILNYIFDVNDLEQFKAQNIEQLKNDILKNILSEYKKLTSNDIQVNIDIPEFFYSSSKISISINFMKPININTSNNDEKILISKKFFPDVLKSKYFINNVSVYDISDEPTTTNITQNPNIQKPTGNSDNIMLYAGGGFVAIIIIIIAIIILKKK